MYWGLPNKFSRFISLGKTSLGLLSICYLLINYMMSFDLHIYLYAHFTDRVQGGSRKLSHLSEEAAASK